MLRRRPLAFATLAVICNLFGTACDEDDACDTCGDDEMCQRNVEASTDASGDIQILDAAGERIAFLMGPSPEILVREADLVIDLGGADVTLPAPVGADTSRVRGSACDRRGDGAPRCSPFVGTVDVTEVVPECAAGACGRLDLTLRIDEANDDDEASVRVRGSIHLRWRERVEHRCVSHPDSSSGGCGRGIGEAMSPMN